MIDQRQLKDTKIKVNHHPDFEFVSPGEEDVFIVAAGYCAGYVHTTHAPIEGYCGGCHGKGYGHYDEYHHFIKCHNDVVVSRLMSIQDEMVEEARFMAGTPGLFGVARHDIIRHYNKNFPSINTYGLESE